MILRLLARACAAVLVLSSPAFLRAQTASAPAASLEGRWAGTLADGDDHTPLGLEFTRNDKGEILAALTVPTTHMQSVPVGPVTVDRDRVEGSGFQLTLADDRLTGTFAQAHLRVDVHRAAELPAPTPLPDVPAGPAPLWTYRAKAAFWATPTLAGDLVIVGAADGSVHAVRLADGQPAWTHATTGPIYGEALVADARVYLVNDAGLLLALDVATGRELWHADLGGAAVARQLPGIEPPYDYDYLAPKPVVADGTLYIGAADGGCHALDAATGKPLWRFAAGGKIRTDALVLPDRVIFTCLDQHVYALDRATGKFLWRTDAGGAVTTSPVLADGNIVVGTRGYRLTALRPADGSQAWSRFQWFSWVESTPVLADGTLYLGSSDNRQVRALAPADGRTLWSTELGGWPWARPAVAASTIFASVAGPSDYPLKPAPVGGLCALDRHTGALLWRRPTAPIPGAYLHGFVGAPVVTGPRLVVAGLDGSLQAFPIAETTPPNASLNH